MTPESKRAELQEIMARIAVRAWTDKGYEKRLQDDPADVLAEEGVAFPGNPPRVVFHFNTDSERHFVVPKAPSSLDLSDGDLKVLAAQRLAIQLELF